MAAETRVKLLQAASTLFARTDSRGVSLRAVARAADVNSALIHYHFGSRDGLFDAAIVQALSRIQDRRRKLLPRLRGTDRLEAHDLARFIVEPLLPVGAETSQATELQLLHRAVSQHGERVEQLTFRHFGDLIYGLASLIDRSLPHIAPRTRQLRLCFAHRLALDRIATGLPSERDECTVATARPLDELGRELITFLAGGIEASDS